MKHVLQALEADAQQLREELSLAPVLEQALASSSGGNKLVLAQLNARAKRMAYVNGVISLYGLVEESVANLLLELAELTQSIYARYSDLPDGVKRSHLEGSLKALMDGDRARLRKPLDAKVGFTNLASNQTDGPLALNLSAFTYATSNFRHKYIVELLRRLDVDVDDSKREVAVVAALTASGLEFRDVDYLLRDLVDRRNQVAHSFRTSELLESDVLAAYLAVIEKYLASLLRKAAETLILRITSSALYSIGTASARWSRVIGVAMTAGEIQAPCKVVILKGDRVAVADIVSLQFDGQDIAGRVEHSTEMIDLGLGTARTVPRWIKGSDVYVLPEKWASLDLQI